VIGREKEVQRQERVLAARMLSQLGPDSLLAGTSGRENAFRCVSESWPGLRCPEPLFLLIFCWKRLVETKRSKLAINILTHNCEKNIMSSSVQLAACSLRTVRDGREQASKKAKI